MSRPEREQCSKRKLAAKFDTTKDGFVGWFSCEADSIC
jgi:hypothetical protein